MGRELKVEVTSESFLEEEGGRRAVTVRNEADQGNGKRKEEKEDRKGDGRKRLSVREQAVCDGV